uniref:Uncharacterized protein n=1 Tax=Molossus molossus TaxID=27622 RepID=A0A7J8EFF7_MOLMO|nr:hypothetical protein HJG59_008874 [Molossus molossus]
MLSLMQRDKVMANCQLSIHNEKTQRGWIVPNARVHLILLPRISGHLLRTHWTLWKTYMITVCLDCSIRQDIPKSFTRKKINLSLSVPKRISRIPYKSNIFSSKSVEFFPLIFFYQILFSTSLWMPFDFYL